MTIRSGVSSDTPGRIVIDAGAVYLNYGLSNQRLLGATRGGNEFTPGRVSKPIEVDGPKGGVKGLKRITEVNPQIIANLIELSVENLIAAIAGANQSDYSYIENEYVEEGDASKVEFDLNQNDVVENSERVYLSDANGVLTLLTKGTVYATRFVGDNLANNKEFETSIGDWIVTDTGQCTLGIVVGGQEGNCMKYTAGSGSPTTTPLSLPGGAGSVLTNLVVGQHYKLRIAVSKLAGAFNPTHLNIKCVGGPVSTQDIAPTSSWKVIVHEFIATGTDATIQIVCQAAPTSGDLIYLDHIELIRVTGGATNYCMNYHDNNSGKAAIVFPQDQIPQANEQITISYTYGAAGTQTTVTGGEIADADYIENVAIVGNVSGKTYPVICVVKNALADAGFSLALAPRDEAVPVVTFVGHYDPSDLDTEPWEIRWPTS